MRTEVRKWYWGSKLKSGVSIVHCFVAVAFLQRGCTIVDRQLERFHLHNFKHPYWLKYLSILCSTLSSATSEPHEHFERWRCDAHFVLLFKLDIKITTGTATMSRCESSESREMLRQKSSNCAIFAQRCQLLFPVSHFLQNLICVLT